MEQATERKITVIPANPKYDYKAVLPTRKKNMAAYCRVSTDSEEQMTSYTAQVNHYTKLLQSRDDWNLVGIYADEGLSGTSVKKRKEFLRMIEDCRAGKIDEIYVKSISRFARNTLDCVTYIRELKELGINIHFEGLNIDTMDSKGELLIMILASIAEDESRNISQNIRWAVEKNFMQGKVMLSTLYGYKKIKKGGIEIVPEQAAIVRRIYNEFLSGYSVSQIAERLEADDIKTHQGKSKWYHANIIGMLTNEKYTGDAILQKTYQASFLNKKRVKNEGQAKQYHVVNSHPAIIDRDTFEKVQAELKRRQDLATDGDKASGKFSSYHIFSTIIKCGECGDTFRRYGHYYKGEKIPVWICKTKQKTKGEKCGMTHIREQKIEDAFVRALNAVLGDKDRVIEEILESAAKIITDADQADHDAKVAELEVLRSQMLELTKQYGASEGKNSEELRTRALELGAEIDRLMAETKFIADLINTKKLARHRMDDIRAMLESGAMLKEFDSAIFKQMIREIVVLSGGELEFIFNCGITAKERI